MPCGQVCKEIIDHGAAVKRAVNCMTNTVLLKHGTGRVSLETAAELRATGDAFALACAKVEKEMAGGSD